MKADAIIKVKGFTSYGVAAITASICEAIIFDQHKILPISHWQEEFNCCLSLPTILGRKGIVGTFPLNLDASEQAFLSESAKTLQQVISENDTV